MINLPYLKNKKIAVIGIGYIGSNILSYLKNLNIEVLAIKDLSIIENEKILICNNVSPKLLLHRDRKLHSPLS